MSAPYVKIVPPLSEYSLVCRGCLADSGEMKNIREWGMTEDFYITNVQLKQSDGISELLCTSCEDALMTCKRFKTQCQQSDITLKNVAQDQTGENEEETNQNSISLTFNETSLTYNITAPNTNEKIHLNCPYKCHNSNFIKKRDLLTHLTKQHSVNKNFKIETKYFCSFTNCQYHISKENKCFTERKLLNQHFLKVHKDKNFRCFACDSAFVTASEYNRHLKSCNVSFNCDIR